jgi:hypothetical protein
VADGDDDAPLVITNAAPVRLPAGGAPFVGDVVLHPIGVAGNREPVVEIVERVKDRIVVEYVFGRSGKTRLMQPCARCLLSALAIVELGCGQATKDSEPQGHTMIVWFCGYQ